MIRRRRLIYNTALLTVSSLLMSCIGMAFQVWLVGRIGSAGIGLYQLVLSVTNLLATFAISGIRFASTRLVSEELGLENPGGIRSAMRRCLGYASFFGAAAGAVLAVRVIRAALRLFRGQMVWLILGLMAGSLYAIVMGPASLDVPQAPVGLQSFDLLGFALGIAVLLGLEALRKWTAQQASSKAMPEKRTVT